MPGPKVKTDGVDGVGREEQVLALAADGVTDREMAALLGISRQTVSTYWKRVMAKLGAASRTQAVAKALQAQLAATRAAEQDLADSVGRLGALLNVLPTGIAIEDHNRQTVYVNACMFELWRLPADHADLVDRRDGAVNQQAVHALVPNQEAFDARVAEIVEKGETVTGEEIVLNDGRIVVRDYVPMSNGGHLWQIRDVTSRRRREVGVQELIHNIANAVVVVDRELTVSLLVGPTVSDPSRYVGAPLSAALPEDSPIYAAVKRCVSKRSKHSFVGDCPLSGLVAAIAVIPTADGGAAAMCLRDSDATWHPAPTP